MCKVCGCGAAEVRIEGTTHGHGHDHEHEHHHSHDGETIHFGHGPAGAHVGGVSQSHLVEIEQNILSKNDGYAQTNRARLEDIGVLALNLVSSPGAGKTTLLVETLKRMKDDFALRVIEGDQESANDAARIRETGVRAIQINTGRGCHLDAHMVGHAMDQLELERNAILFIENIGNLVCPAGFDLGEAAKIVILSVTEGDDKPVKYPDAFAAADLMVLSKIDLLPHVDFDVARCFEHAACVNPDIQTLQLSAKTGQGMEQWAAWITARQHQVLEAEKRNLEARLAELNSTLQAAEAQNA